MELREYWRIIARRWPLIAIVTGLAFAVSAVILAFAPPSYKAELRFSISVRPEPRQGNYYTYDRYYTWLTAEYLVDDFGEVIKSDAFAKDISDRLGQKVHKESIQRGTKTVRTHRILTVSVTTGNQQDSLDIATAMKQVMEEKAPDYFAQLTPQDAMLRVIDGPVVEPEMGLIRRVAEVGLRTAAGLVAAVALAFLLHYLDPSVRDAREAERLLGLPVLAEVPRTARS